MRAGLSPYSGRLRAMATISEAKSCTTPSVILGVRSSNDWSTGVGRLAPPIPANLFSLDLATPLSILAMRVRANRRAAAGKKNGRASRRLGRFGPHFFERANEHACELSDDGLYRGRHSRADFGGAHLFWRYWALMDLRSVTRNASLTTSSLNSGSGLRLVK